MSAPRKGRNTEPRERVRKKSAQGRQSELLEMNGHKLPPDLAERFYAQLRSIQESSHFKTWTHNQLEARALDDVIYKHKPSSRSKEICWPLYRVMQECGTALSQVAEWPWCHHSEMIRTPAHNLLVTAANKLQVVARQILEYERAVAEEEKGYVQDWLKLDSRLKKAADVTA